MKEFASSYKGKKSVKNNIFGLIDFLNHLI